MVSTLLNVGLVLALCFAETATDKVFQRLRELGFGEAVARAIADRRPDLVDGIILEQRTGVPAAESSYRPIRLYRGMETLVESYDAINGRGRVMNSDGGRWMTTLIETAQFFAGLTGSRRPGNPEVLNRGVVLQLEVVGADEQGIPIAHL